MTTGTAPSPEDIRLAVFQRWNRQRTADDPRGAGQSLQDRMVDTITFDLLCEVNVALFGPYDGPDTRSRLDEIADEVLLPVLADLDARVMAAMATVFQRYVAETRPPR